VRIAYVARSVLPAPTANSIHVMRMAGAYASRGHEVSLYVPGARGLAARGAVDPFDYYGVARAFRIRRVREVLPGIDTVNYGVAFPLTVAASRPHLVHARTLLPAARLASLYKVPTIFELHNHLPANRRWRRHFARLVGSAALAAVIVITEALADLVRPELPARVKLIVAPDGVERARVEADMGRGVARERLGLPQDGRFLAVYAGHLYPGRGIETIIAAARQFPEAFFYVIGGDPERVSLYRERARGAANAVFTGHRPPAEVPLWLAAADALLMPYGGRVETVGGGDTSAIASPLKMFEYLAAGRPILASTLPVLREVLRDGENAVLLPHDRPEEWAAALRRIAADPGGVAGMAAQARADAAHYTWEGRAQRILAAVGV
jgi:glycosyltransferase involved in cell wall biosynthesis